MAHIRGYTALKKTPKRPLIAAWDLETRGFGGEVLSAQWCLEDGKPQFIEGSHVDIIRSMVDVFEANNNYAWYAHFAQYDWRYLFDEFDLREYEYELHLRTDSDLYMITIKEPSITLLDSFAFWPGTLDELTKRFAPNLPKLKIDIENYNPKNPEHRAYALRDAEALAVALVNLDQKLVETYGVRIGATSAGTAIKAWRRTLTPEEQYFNDDKNEDFIRSGYFGGLVFITRTDEIKAHTIDINSCYPFVMREYGVPYGQCVERNTIDWGRPGLYQVIVKTPDDLIIPILPKRIEKGSSKIVRWPSGIFETTVTMEELLFAIEHGYKILKVIRGLAWEKMIFPFTKFVDKAEHLRNEFTGQPEEALAKRMQNSTYGRYATRRERRKIFKPQTQEDYLDAFPWDDGGRFWYRIEHDADMICLPQWAVYITAHARLHLLRTAYDVVGVENVAYGDTDSLTITNNVDLIDVGKKYGQFKIEKTWIKFRAIAPKVYTGVLAKKEASGFYSFDFKGAAKGMPRKQMDVIKWGTLFDEGVISANLAILPRLTQYLKGRTEIETQSRKSSNINNSRNWKRYGDLIRPMRLDEYDESEFNQVDLIRPEFKKVRN